MMRGLLPPYASRTMNAPAPKQGFACGGSVTKIQKILCPPCLGEALRRVSFVERTIFIVRGGTESIHVRFFNANFFHNVSPLMRSLYRLVLGLAVYGFLSIPLIKKNCTLKPPRGRPIGRGDVHRIWG